MPLPFCGACHYVAQPLQFFRGYKRVTISRAEEEKKLHRRQFRLIKERSQAHFSHAARTAHGPEADYPRPRRQSATSFYNAAVRGDLDTRHDPTGARAFITA